MNNSEFFNLLKKRCLYCNQGSSECLCPLDVNKTKLICRIDEKMLKKGKWITIVYGKINKNDFKTLKNKIGTGGNFFIDKVCLRGCISNRVKQVLKLMDYQVL